MKLRLLSLCFVALGLLLQNSVIAQNPPSKTEQGTNEVSGHLKLGGVLTIKIGKADDLKKIRPTPDAAPKAVSLKLDCLDMKLPSPEVCSDANQVVFHFLLSRIKNSDTKPDDGNENQWRRLLRGSGSAKSVEVRIQVTGTPDDIPVGQRPLETDTGSVWSWAAWAIIAAVVFLILIYGTFSNLLRDLTFYPEKDFKQDQPGWLAWVPGLAKPAGGTRSRPPYSLGRVQMAFWTVIILGAYLYLWMVLGEINSFNATALTLLGFSIGTGLLGRTIDSSKQGDLVARLAEQKQLKARETELKGKKEKNETTPAEDAELARIEARLTELTRLTTEATETDGEHVSQGWLTDILSDESGVSLHRLQTVAWTLVLGLVFVIGVTNDLAMPVFDNTLLALMGISSGAYLGFKVPEKKTVAPLPAQ